MRLAIAAALALTAASSGHAQTPVLSDLSYSVPIAGSWAYVPANDGSEAVFSTAGGQPQLTIRCTRSTRRVDVLKAASAASATMWLWTSSEAKSVPATHDAAGGRVIASFGAHDPLLDAIVHSRGRIGVSTSGLPALVVPPWGEVSRVIEDCRV